MVEVLLHGGIDCFLKATVSVFKRQALKEVSASKDLFVFLARFYFTGTRFGR